MRGRLALACGVLSLVVGAASATAAPASDPTKQCKKGYVPGTGSGTSFDENGNGFVCVDQETGAITDDKEQFAPDENPEYGADQNGNMMVCYNLDNGVTTDDTPLEEGQPIEDACPPGFILWPAHALP